MKGHSGFQIGTGVTSILMIFVVLCLTTFAILSYTSADADLKLSKEHTAYIEGYYDTYSRLNEELAKMDTLVYRMIQEGETDAYGMQKIIMALQIKKSSDITAVYSSDNQTIKATISSVIDDSQSLVMEISFDISGQEKRCIVNRCYVYSEDDNVTQEETLADMWGG